MTSYIVPEGFLALYISANSEKIVEDMNILMKAYIMVVTKFAIITHQLDLRQGFSNAVNFVSLEQCRLHSVLDIIYETSNQIPPESYSMIFKTSQNNYSAFIVQSSRRSITDPFSNVSEAVLRNRWKSVKWRFGHTVAILSESLEFASSGFLIYGPNISEHDSMFLIMSQKSFDIQNGTRKFQRDAVYRKMYPKLVLITYGEFGCYVQVICILCQNALSPSVISLKGESQEELSSVLESVDALNQGFNIGKGHGSVALLCQVGFRGQIRDVNYHKSLELTARRKYDKIADKVGIILGILINRFNFSLKQEPWTNLQGNYSGIYLSTGGDMPQTYIYGRQLTLTYIISEFFMYCRQVPIISSTGWDFLWAPLDYATWGLVFVTAILFSIYHRGQVSYGLDIFWAILAIPPNSDWTRSKLLSCSLVVLLNLNVGYLSVITSKVIIPNREADIETPAELFQQGFRFIDNNVSVLGPGFVGYWGKFLEAAKINTSEISNVLAQVDDSCFETHNPKCISKWASLATGVLYSHEKIQKLLSIPVDMRDKCHGVKKPFRAYWVAFYSQGPLASIIYDTYQALTATGIDSFWDKLQKTSSVYVAFREANHTQTRNGDPPKLNFKTPILVVFKAYGALMLICIMSFPIEIFYHLFRNRNRSHDSKKQLFKNTKIPFTVTRECLGVTCSRVLQYCCAVEERPKVNQPRIILVSNFSNSNANNKFVVKPRVQVLLW